MTFSIITVTYNAGQWLERTIQSIINQSYKNIEYIIIDGNSTDGTLDIIQNYEIKINNSQLSIFNFQFISEPDNGLYDAMNKGLAMATGDYVWFINAGDTLHSPDTLQEITAQLKKIVSLPDVIYGETMIVDAQGISVGRRRLKAPARLTWKSFRMGMLVSHQSFIVRREIAPRYDLNYPLTADFDWCIRCLQQARQVWNTQLVLSNFLEDGMSSRQRKVSLRERYRIMCRYYGKTGTVFRHVWFTIRFYIAKIIKGRV
ncbi:MAG: glycosyltransferase [Dysgonamonadaceae bacterium]|jgi:glycosyltransferase involved in cell wall biosynthesis|nr:glycosyltransferase [Dysgonamonadaceae bacterium]